jgi:D-sedoheptulose 7-phosphate isomerase
MSITLPNSKKLQSKQIIEHSVSESIRALRFLQEPQAVKFMESVAETLANCFRSGNKVLIAGNGGSLCDATHFAEELTGLFRQFRPALPAIPLSDPGHMSCVANDIGYEWVFARAIQAYGKKGDVFIGLTTSGKSPSIVKAIEVAKEMGLHTVTFLGKGGGKLKGVAHQELSIDDFSTSDRIQEAHMAAMHIIIEVVEQHMFPELF